MKRIAASYGLSVLSCLSSGSLAFAGSMGEALNPPAIHPIITLQGGYACIESSSKSLSFVGDDSNLFVYTPSGSSCDSGFIGAFVGGERFLKEAFGHPLFVQFGVEYNAFGKIDLKGQNTVGVDSATFTQYSYRYTVETEQILGGIKLLSTKYQWLHPYGEAGLGIALNRARAYQVSTTEIGSLNATPNFANESTTRLSYIFGLGLETQVVSHVRAALGYRFSYFGQASLGEGWISAGTVQRTVPFNLNVSSLYANQLLARLTYAV